MSGGGNVAIPKILSVLNIPLIGNNGVSALINSHITTNNIYLFFNINNKLFYINKITKITNYITTNPSSSVSLINSANNILCMCCSNTYIWFKCVSTIYQYTINNNNDGSLTLTNMYSYNVMSTQTISLTTDQSITFNNTNLFVPNCDSSGNISILSVSDNGMSFIRNYTPSSLTYNYIPYIVSNSNYLSVLIPKSNSGGSGFLLTNYNLNTNITYSYSTGQLITDMCINNSNLYFMIPNEGIYRSSFDLISNVNIGYQEYNYSANNKTISGLFIACDNTNNNLWSFTAFKGSGNITPPYYTLTQNYVYINNPINLQQNIIFNVSDTTTYPQVVDDGTYLWVYNNNILTQIEIAPYYICFLETTKILTNKGYREIKELRKGDLVKTSHHGFKKIHLIGKKEVAHPRHEERIKNQLYKCTEENFPEVFEDLIVTGCHSILVDDFVNEEQKKTTEEVLKGMFVTDGKYRLPACVDERTQIYEKPGDYMVYNFALEHEDFYMNYGVYANGLLVESSSKRFLEDYELSHMELID